MKKFYVFLILIITTLYSYADLGNSLVYQVEIQLKNNSFIIGYFEIDSYDEEAYLDSNGLNKYCSNEGMMHLVRIRVQREGYGPDNRPIENSKFTLYKNIHYPVNFKRPTSDMPPFGIVNEKDVVVVDTNDIKKISFIGVKQNKRDWLQSELVIAPSDIIDALYYSEPINFYYQAFGGDDPNEYMSGFYVFSYNKNLTEKELKQLVENYYNKSWGLTLNFKEYLNQFTTWKSKTDYEIDTKGYLKFIELKKEEILKSRKELLLKKIIIINVWNTC